MTASILIWKYGRYLGHPGLVPNRTPKLSASQVPHTNRELQRPARSVVWARTSARHSYPGAGLSVNHTLSLGGSRRKKMPVAPTGSFPSNFAPPRGAQTLVCQPLAVVCGDLSKPRVLHPSNRHSCFGMCTSRLHLKQGEAVKPLLPSSESYESFWWAQLGSFTAAALRDWLVHRAAALRVARTERAHAGRGIWLLGARRGVGGSHKVRKEAPRSRNPSAGVAKLMMGCRNLLALRRLLSISQPGGSSTRSLRRPSRAQSTPLPATMALAAPFITRHL